MANYTYVSDLLDDILFRAGEPTDSTSDFYAAALRYLNRAYQSIWMGGGELVPEMDEHWWWLRKTTPGVLTLQPAIATGTVSVTNNSTSITFSSAPAVDLDNWFFQVDGHDDVFRISAHTAAAAAATLDGVYTGTDAATASYKVFKLEYSLASDVLKVIAPMRGYRDGEVRVPGMDLVALERDYPLATVDEGVPSAFAHVTESLVRFNRYPGRDSTDLLRLEYDYLYEPDDLEDGAAEPVVPRHYRKVLSDVALMFLFIDKNDDRADAIGLAAKAGLMRMARENRNRQNSMSTGRMGHLYPRADQKARWEGPLRTSSGLVIG